MSATTHCPECFSDIPVPRFRRGKGEIRIRCKICRSLLSIERSPEVQAEFSEEDDLGRAFSLPGYELLGVLGRGGMGMVFSAVRNNDHELLAVKVLPPECWRYPELLQRFHMEAEMMASLDHPNIVPIVDRGRWNEYPYIVMDYVPGCTLKRRIEKSAPLHIDEVIAIAAPVAEAIQACHDRGLVHRDLKPGNVLLSQSGRVLVTDFGIANLLQRLGDNTDHGVMIGTPQYIAPEQMQNGSSVGVRADQYSLGVIIYEMLTRALPMGIFDPPSSRCKEMNKQAEAMLMKALAHDERNRFENVRQFMRALKRELNRPPSAIPTEELIRKAATAYEPKDRDFPGAGPSLRVAVLNDSGNVIRQTAAATTIVDMDRVADGFFESSPSLESHESRASLEVLPDLPPPTAAPPPAENPVPEAIPAPSLPLPAKTNATPVKKGMWLPIVAGLAAVVLIIIFLVLILT